ncbi:kelch repeat domain containing/Serine/threonine protein phosphatase protein [Toxoplasma gondii ME49]|uniref:Serine/threonine-protein phosphatase n=4 Tax=Toxoplasma gondii TaxID=5811 RepID=S8GHS2_TOXGM|nr:kelch repeat domain containing/Serine/threonine protein phosphatase protein [Toxoplasma gondii ME49]EPT28004.1 kelch repeat domain containing/Serine/threonine protein phosphatase protein [Toxoplasma gondii ME49]|eukprot:XP_002368432.1 kelch repeat domain containing/Serine/threonine protein phosphatase protein [Toxoplasma gondii ME49]
MNQLHENGLPGLPSASAAPVGSSSAGNPAGKSEFLGVPKSIQQTGDVPPPRFGHTCTCVGNHKVVVFGGAVGSAGGYSITNESYLFDITGCRWHHLFAENPPPPRAAHAACCVDTLQLVVFGGATGGGSLSAEELYLLDLRKDPELQWMPVPLQGITPGRRYGHSMVYNKPNIIVFGGNDGERPLADVWFMDVEKSPFRWEEVVFEAQARRPPPRVYHATEVCREGPASGMMVVFGGRSTSSRSLNDTWGLRQHRDGRWDWIAAPSKKQQAPEPRFQHSMVFIGSKMLVVGGRTDNDSTKPLSTAVYDTETVEWRFIASVGRFRHSSWTLRSSIYTFGGFSHITQQHPTADLTLLDCCLIPNFYNEREREDLRRKQALQQEQQMAVASAVSAIQAPPAPAAPPAAPASASSPPSSALPAPSSAALLAVRGLPGQNGRDEKPRTSLPQTQGASPPTQQGQMPAQQSSQGGSAPLRPSWTFAQRSQTRQLADIKLASHVSVVHETGEDFSSLVRRISIDRLEEEGKKINKEASLQEPLPTASESKRDMFADRILKLLLRPLITQQEVYATFNTDAPFAISWNDVTYLCDVVLDIVKNDDMVLHLRAPIKVYGDIHGQYYDLMRLFHLYKMPVEEERSDEFAGTSGGQHGAATTSAVGDIDTNDYLFLGDYVDRGLNSLETICLLFALKVKYPRQIHLLRGNHEDPAINSLYGFQDECKRRLREDPFDPSSCWRKFNLVFEYLPVAAIIDDSILCIHGGIGGSISSVEELAAFQRPLKVAQVPQNVYEQRVTDLLWSDPTDNDSMLGVVRNDIRDPDGSGRIYKFGPDRVHRFLAENDLQLIIRAHECVMDGFERFAGGKLITLFSATNYCNHHQNAGALLFIRRDMTIIPKLIYPANAPSQYNSWDSRMAELRPPTPPRAAPRMRETDFGAGG